MDKESPGHCLGFPYFAADAVAFGRPTRFGRIRSTSSGLNSLTPLTTMPMSRSPASWFTRCTETLRASAPLDQDRITLQIVDEVRWLRTSQGVEGVTRRRESSVEPQFHHADHMVGARQRSFTRYHSLSVPDRSERNPVLHEHRPDRAMRVADL